MKGKADFLHKTFTLEMNSFRDDYTTVRGNVSQMVC